MAPTLHAHRAAGKSTPTSDKAHVASAGRVEEHGAADSADFAARPAVGQANKAFATLRAHFEPLPQPPRRVRLAAGVLVLPPVTLADLPPGGSLGSFMGIAALTFATPIGTVACFLHDLAETDVALILRAQRLEAEAQLGAKYAKRPLWWEACI